MRYNYGEELWIDYQRAVDPTKEPNVAEFDPKLDVDRYPVSTFGSMKQMRDQDEAVHGKEVGKARGRGARKSRGARGVMHKVEGEDEDEETSSEEEEVEVVPKTRSRARSKGSEKRGTAGNVGEHRRVRKVMQSGPSGKKGTRPPLSQKRKAPGDEEGERRKDEEGPAPKKSKTSKQPQGWSGKEEEQTLHEQLFAASWE
jgi:hypothetical protein